MLGLMVADNRGKQAVVWLFRGRAGQAHHFHHRVQIQQFSIVQVSNQKWNSSLLVLQFFCCLTL